MSILMLFLAFFSSFSLVTSIIQFKIQNDTNADKKKVIKALIFLLYIFGGVTLLLVCFCSDMCEIMNLFSKIHIVKIFKIAISLFSLICVWIAIQNSLIRTTIRGGILYDVLLYVGKKIDNQ
jgi:O-antigen/teichoic acid export membrane protein